MQQEFLNEINADRDHNFKEIYIIFFFSISKEQFIKNFFFIKSIIKYIISLATMRITTNVIRSRNIVSELQKDTLRDKKADQSSIEAKSKL